LPQALLQIMDLAERDDVGLAELAEVVARDTGLAAKVLAVAGSAYYSRGRTIVTLEQCLSVLGAAQVRRIALNQSVAELFGRFKHTGVFDMRPYWHHVLGVAITTRALCQHLAPQLGYAQPDEAYLAGLLHNVGQLALLSALPDVYLPLTQQARDEDDLLQREQAALGLDHAEAGGWLAEGWQLHGFFADALRYHHAPLERLADAHALTQLVGLAHRLTDHLDAVNAKQDGRLKDADLAPWGLDLAEAMVFATAAEEEAKAVAEALGLEILPRSALPDFPAAQDHDPTQARLAAAVETRLEAQSTLPSSLVDESLQAICTGVLQAARMLFGQRQAALFLIQDQALQGYGDDDSRLGELRIRLPAPDSVIAQAQSGGPRLAGDNPSQESLADAQALRILGCERLLCLGLNHENRCLGVLVMGLSAKAAQAFLLRHSLLSTFAREAAQRLGVALDQLQSIQGLRASALADYQLHARKIVHEANNPLASVRNYIALLRQQVGKNAQAQEDMDLVESELRRVARILQDLKNVDAASVMPHAGAGVDLNALINEVIRFCRLGRPEMERVATHLDLDDSLPEVRVNGDKFKQVLTNLIFNAAEAMPEGGEVTISSANWQSAPGQHAVEITVSDTGPGLPPGVLEQLYQPKKTEKGGSHQGLGLSIVGSLVKELGGVMQCKSSHAGTRFKILLPAGLPGKTSHPGHPAHTSRPGL